MMLLPPRATIFPYTTLFRSAEIPQSLEQIQMDEAQMVLKDLYQKYTLQDNHRDNLALHRVHIQYQECVHVNKARQTRSEEHTSELQSQSNLVCRLLLEKQQG